jgi:hypothetical protein
MSFSMRNLLLSWTVLGAFLAMAGFVSSQQAVATTSGAIHTIQLREDRFLNYDFRSESASRTNADWPIDFLFYGNASINKVKKKLRPWLGWKGSSQYAKVNNGTGWVWDSDKGIKTQLCPIKGQTAAHMRIYAPPTTDTLWNRGWGYYVIASSHFDHQECWSGAKFGWSENTEHWIASRARDAWGEDAVDEDYLELTNAIYGVSTKTGDQVPYADGNHIWFNDGLATIVDVD